MKKEMTKQEKEEIAWVAKEETAVPEDPVPAEETSLLRDNRGVGVVEIILILVVIFTIYKGCK